MSPKALGLASILLTTGGCSWSWHSPVMKGAPSAAIDARPSPGRSRVVFVHEPIDAGARLPWQADHQLGAVRIIDESGKLVGDALPATWFAVEMTPGEHQFFGWQTYWESRFPEPVGGCACLLHQCMWVAAMRAELAAGRTYFVLVTRDHQPPFLSTAWIDLQAISPQVGRWPPSLLRSLRPLVVDADRARTVDDDYATKFDSSFACIGRARMRGPYWDSGISTIHEEDGR